MLCRDAIQLSCRRADNRRYRVVPFVPGCGAAVRPGIPLTHPTRLPGSIHVPCHKATTPAAVAAALLDDAGRPSVMAWVTTAATP